jgi:HKD family nuclease
MTTTIITNKISTISTLEVITQQAIESRQIVAAVAFFSDPALILKWLNSGIKITLIVSLRPPTNYYSLKDILHEQNIEIYFYGDEFHSKIFAFYDNEKIISSIIGSSNFTNGGLIENIETNVIIKEKQTLLEIDELIEKIILNGIKLQPDILLQYKERYDNFKKYKERDRNKINLKKPKEPKKIVTKASEYNDFWKIADKVKDIVKEISEKEFPKTPVYLAIDHFWHWVVKICDPTWLKGLQNNNLAREKIIFKLYKDYCAWDKSTGKHTHQMGPRSQKIKRLLSKNKIQKLSKQEAIEIYRSFHATGSLIQRFDADKNFIKNNSITKIRKSFKHLLDNTIPIDVRISDLIRPNGEYKLNHFGPSCVQELIGWANPYTMPIRNNKADKAVKLLGFKK